MLLYTLLYYSILRYVTVYLVILLNTSLCYYCTSCYTTQYFVMLLFILLLNTSFYNDIFLCGLRNRIRFFPGSGSGCPKKTGSDRIRFRIRNTVWLDDINICTWDNTCASFFSSHATFLFIGKDELLLDNIKCNLAFTIGPLYKNKVALLHICWCY